MIAKYVPSRIASTATMAACLAARMLVSPIDHDDFARGTGSGLPCGARAHAVDRHDRVDIGAAVGKELVLVDGRRELGHGVDSLRGTKTEQRGSCITDGIGSKDRPGRSPSVAHESPGQTLDQSVGHRYPRLAMPLVREGSCTGCLLYTSDAA